MATTKAGRRRFLRQATVAGIAVGTVPALSAQMEMMPTGGAAATGSAAASSPGAAAPPGNPTDRLAYGIRSRHEKTTRAIAGDSVNPEHLHFGRMLNVLTPLQDIVGSITPTPLHFVSAHGYTPPDIDPKAHRLMIQGMVERPLVFTLDELKQLPSVSRITYLECQANRPEYKQETLELTFGKTGCCQWTGVLLSTLLKEAGLRSDASWIVAEGSENGRMTKSTPLSKAMDDVLIAYGQNGEAVRPENGYPLRLVVPGFEAIHSVKWLRQIKVTNRPYMGFQETSRYSPRTPKGILFTFAQGPKSVITFPSGGQKLTRHGFHEIRGLAWSGGGRVTKAEVSTDRGKTWKEASLQGPVLPVAHTRFTLPWHWSGEDVVLMSRCTDELGEVQPTLAQFAKYWGATSAEFLAGTASGAGHSNAIQPWGIKPDGSVYNAIS
jgi:sulfane dehydrogenase subunit SoxC